MNLKVKRILSSDLNSIFKFELLSAQTAESYNIFNLLEKPKDTSFGQMALPVFVLSKALRLSPPEIAKRITEYLKSLMLKDNNYLSYIEDIHAVSGFINFKFKSWFLAQELERLVSTSDIGFSLENKNKKLVIDYSSPNVAKPMSIGHLRATVIGQAIRNLAETQGYEVVGLNHLGDWGVQFGKLAWAYTQWQSEYDFKNDPFKSLFDMYVRFHDEAEKDETLNEMGSKTFILLEQGDPEITALWQMFVEISMKEYQRLWDRLGVKHDLVRGESFYSDQLEQTIKLVEDKGLLEESMGAYVVNVGEDMPPCLIKKTDGASLYATRDLASAIYRHDILGCDLNLYVVGVDQTLHFKQVFKTLELMGYDWAKDCHHISFGMYRFKDLGKMSTRKGRAIFLEDVLNKSVEHVKEIIEQKNPNLENKDLVAEQVGVGAIIFNDLMNDRVKDVDFDWAKILDFEGDSGPYLQYTSVRCLSVLNKFKEVLDQSIPEKYLPETTLEKEETDLMALLISYESVLSSAFEKFKPSIVANFLLDLSRAYNVFFNKHRIVDPENLITSGQRALLTKHTQQVLAAGLGVLNIQVPQKM
jgi:arginyl-tRNA synthetase